MKKLLLFLTFTLLTSYTFSQNTGWLRRAGGTNGDVGNSVTTDANENVYVTGYYKGTSTFGTTTFTSAGSMDIFVAKYDSAGTLLWAKTAGGGGDDNGRGVACDAAGNVYVTGSCKDTAHFDTDSVVAPSSQDEFFLVSYDPAGTLRWLKHSSSGFGIAWGLSLSVFGNNIYVMGNYSATRTIGTSTFNAVGSTDMFVVSYNMAGGYNNGWSFGGPGYDDGQDIHVASTNEIFVTGAFSDSINLPIGTLLSAGNEDVFIIKFDGTGNSLAALYGGGANQDVAHSVAVDANAVYITGYFQGPAQFASTSFAGVGGRDLFLIKYKRSDLHQVFANAYGGPNDDYGNDLALDKNGNPFISGIFTDTATFVFNTIYGKGGEEIFFGLFDTTGNVNWLLSAGGHSTDEGIGVTASAHGDLYGTGSFRDTAKFDIDSVMAAGNNDFYLVKFRPGPTGVHEVSENSQVKIYPNPSNDRLYIICEESGNFEITIRDILGRVLKHHSILHDGDKKSELFTGNLQQGIYFLEISNGQTHAAVRFVKE